MTRWRHSVQQWWDRRTIRFRLAAWYAAGSALLLAAFSATLYIYVAERMARPLAYQLRRDLAEVLRHLEVNPNRELLWKVMRARLSVSM